MNSLFNQLQGQRTINNLLPNNIRNMIQMFKGMRNPQAYIQQAMDSNPQLKSILQASNGNPEQAFRSLAQQMNVNPDDIINMLK